MEEANLSEQLEGNESPSHKSDATGDQIALAEVTVQDESFTVSGHQYPEASTGLLIMPSLSLNVADPMAPNNQLHTSDIGLLHGTNVEDLGADLGGTGGFAGPNLAMVASQVTDEYMKRTETTHLHYETPAPMALPHRQPQGRKPRKDFAYRLKEVENFKLKHGHCMIPHKYKENPSLGTWTDTQRRRYRKTMEAKRKQVLSIEPDSSAKRNSGLFISQEHIDQLEAVGFIFEPRLSRKETWERRVQEIQAYKAKHGHCNVREDDVANPGLGKWVSYVRRTYRLSKQKKDGKNKSKLSNERISQLKSIGFVFELKEEMAMKRFQKGIQGLKDFHEKEGHIEVPKFFSANPTLGLCVEDMRTEFRKILKSIAEGGDPYSDTMTAEMVKELSNMGFLASENEGALEFRV